MFSGLDVKKDPKLGENNLNKKTNGSLRSFIKLELRHMLMLYINNIQVVRHFLAYMRYIVAP